MKADRAERVFTVLSAAAGGIGGKIKISAGQLQKDPSLARLTTSQVNQDLKALAEAGKVRRTPGPSTRVAAEYEIMVATNGHAPATPPATQTEMANGASGQPVIPAAPGVDVVREVALVVKARERADKALFELQGQYNALQAELKAARAELARLRPLAEAVTKAGFKEPEPVTA
jgi:hypothetical protein